MASPATEGLRFLRFYSRIHTSKVCHQLSETSYTGRYRIRRCCREEREGKRFSISREEGPAHCVRSNTFALHLASTLRLSMRIPTNSNVMPHVEWTTGNLDKNTTGLFYRSRLCTRRDRRMKFLHGRGSRANEKNRKYSHGKINFVRTRVSRNFYLVKI